MHRNLGQGSDCTTLTVQTSFSVSTVRTPKHRTLTTTSYIVLCPATQEPSREDQASSLLSTPYQCIHTTQRAMLIELYRAGLKHASCMVGVRDPVDRAISCLHYFFSAEMEGVQHMSDREFYRSAIENTQSNYAAAYMLASGTAAISEREAYTMHKNTSASKAVAASTVKILERCVVISLSDVRHESRMGNHGTVFACVPCSVIPLNACI